VTVSHDHFDHNNISALKGDPFVVKSAGEYDFRGVMVQGVDSYHDENGGVDRGRNVIYRIDMDGVSVTHLGDLGHLLENKQLEVLAGTDILLIPVGGKYTINAKKATEVISQIQPRLVIPMHYSLPDLTVDIEGVEGFVKELGLKPTYEEKLKISAKELPQEDMELVILNSQG
jgi:L-ascorbate metabolism protein UlaG (beta-lactamase superfamily)